MNPAKNLYWSLVRTVMPGIVAVAIGWLTDNFGALVDKNTQAQLVACLYIAAAFIYYLIVRLIETYVTPKIGFLLADFRKGNTAPIYPDSIETTVVPAAPAIEAGAAVRPAPDPVVAPYVPQHGTPDGGHA